MTNTRCPDCGAPTSPGAVVCPQCGFPIRPDAMPLQGGRPGGGGGSSARTLIIVAVVVVGLMMVGFVGVIAAIAIPQFAKASARAKEKDGEALLKWAYTAEQTYFAQNGRYTSKVAELSAPGRPARASGPELYTLEVSAASDRELCLEAVPTPAAGRDVNALSMDVDGGIYRSAGCSGEPHDWVPPEIAGPSGAEGARQMMHEVHEGIVAYHAEHGQYPTTTADVLTRVHDTPASRDFTMAVIQNNETGGVCVAAVPRGSAEGKEPLSVDQDGKLYDDATCTGTVLETFTTPSGDGGSSSADSPADSAEPAAKREDKDLLPIERAP